MPFTQIFRRRGAETVVATPDLLQLAVVHADKIGRALVAILGVMLIRPMAPAGSPPLSKGKRLALGMALTIGAAIYAVERLESYLPSFVIAVGIGFSGQSIVELIGREALNIARERIASVRAAVGTLFSKGGEKP